MNNVVFLAPSDGGNASIWAANGVSGSFVGTPTVGGDAVQLSSDQGLAVSFQIQKWAGTQWGATVNSGGTYTSDGAMNNGSTIRMNGAAAGTHANSSFTTGTGAGVVRPAN